MNPHLSHPGARSAIPGVALSSDFIAGFCGETEADHEHTVDLIRHVTYDMAFLFAYSSRERTAAQRRLDDDVPDAVKSRRLGEIIQAFRDGREALSRAAVGQTHLVLVEGPPKRRPKHLQDTGDAVDVVAGRNDANRKLIFPDCLPDGSSLKAGDFAHVLVDHTDGTSLFGVPVKRANGASDRPRP